MSRRSRFVAILSLLCTASLFAGELKTDIRRGNDDWIEAMKTFDAKLVARAYADDATFCKTDGSCLHGRAEIEKLYAARFAAMKPVKNGKVTSKEIVRDGDFAYEWGSAEVTLADGKVSGGRYFTIWRLQKSGAWQIWRNLVLP